MFIEKATKLFLYSLLQSRRCIGLSDLVEVSSLKPKMKNLNLKIKVVEKSEPKEVISKKDGSIHTVVEATVGDKSGVVILTLWDDSIQKVEVGKTYLLSNVFTGFFKNHLRLNIGRNSSMELIEENIEDVNVRNNVSAKVYKKPFLKKRNRRFVKKRNRKES